MISEVLMKPGDWSVDLLPTAPYRIKSKPEYHGHIVITPLRLDDGVLTRAGVISKALYMGIIRRRSDDFLHFGGPHILAYLGDEQQKTNYSGTAWAGGTQWSAVMNHAWTNCHGWTSEPNGIEQGTYYQNPTNSATEVAGGLDHRSIRSNIDAIGAFWGGIEYRVRTSSDGLHAYCDFGSTGVYGLFKVGMAGGYSNATVLLVRDNAGRDAGLTGLQLVEGGLRFAGDHDSYSNGLLVHLPTLGDLYGTIHTVPGWDGVNGASWHRGPFNLPSDNGTMTADYSNAYYDREVLERFTCSASIREYGPTRFLIPGDDVLVYDPPNGLVDASVEARYWRGEVLQPLALRCTAINWPLEEGMGVYCISADTNNVVTDLTDYVEWETGRNSTLTLGTPPRPLATALATQSTVY